MRLSRAGLELLFYALVCACWLGQSEIVSGLAGTKTVVSSEASGCLRLSECVRELVMTQPIGRGHSADLRVAVS